MRVSERFAGFAGAWTGENRLRMMPDDAFDSSASTAIVALAAGNNAVTIHYTWADFDGDAQDGLLALSDGPLPGRVDTIWVDSWHQHPRWMPMIGSASNTSVSLSGTYGDGEETGSWHIHLHLDDAETLIMTMENDIPESGVYEVVRAVWRRT